VDDDVIKYGLHLLGDDDEFGNDDDADNYEVGNYANASQNGGIF
jgi:hypothetical protein